MIPLEYLPLAFMPNFGHTPIGAQSRKEERFGQQAFKGIYKNKKGGSSYS